MNIRLVLESIRSLLGQFPIQNEPGFESVNPNDISSIEYNQYIIYNTYKLAIIDVLNNKFKNISDKFIEEIKNEFNKNKKKLLDDLESYNEIYKDGVVENRIYFMKKTKLEFSKIVKDFKLINL